MTIKYIYVIIILATCSGCWYMGKKTSYGLPRKNIKPLAVGDISSTNIDTSAIYKAVVSFKDTKHHYYYEKEADNPYRSDSYLKFYNNGKLGLFIIRKEDSSNLKRELFNPLQATMGYYSIKGEAMTTKHAFLGDGGIIVSKMKGYARNDTLLLRDKNSRGTIYIKKYVPPGLVDNWTPDW